VAAQTAASVARAPAPVPAAAPQPAAAASGATCEQVLARLDALGEDKPAKLALLAMLPETLHQEVLAALKLQKAERERQARAAELEDLL
jgi:hypothetical protein